MSSFFIYLLQASVVFSIVFLAYKFFLSKLTFHAVNRFLLLGLVPISLLIPFSKQIMPETLFQETIDMAFMDHIRLGALHEIETMSTATDGTTINYWTIALIIYSLGVLFCLYRMINTTRSLWVLKKRSLIHKKEGYKLIENENSEIFSFFNWIFIPKETATSCDPWILEHERAHARMKHSLDILFIELFITFFWINPFVYMYRRSIKSLHEFQVDHMVLSKDVKLSEYMELLLQSLKIKKPNTLYSYFHHPMMKKRIDMMTKERSNNFSKAKYLLLFPLCAFLFFAFAKPQERKVEVVNTIETPVVKKALSFIFPVKGATKKDISSFFTKNRKHPVLKINKAHEGIDIRADQGTPVVASEEGIVVLARKEAQWGNLVVVKHAEGYETWYAHMYSLNTQEKKRVKKGEVIGYVGSTGNTTGPHLHFELRDQGKKLNPLNYIED